MPKHTQFEHLFALAAEAAEAEACRLGESSGVAAAAQTRSGAELVGVWIDAMVDSACLCAETGPICESHRMQDPIVASICVRWVKSSTPLVLPACGVCQERLAVFGTDVVVGVGRTSGVTEYMTLEELRPFPWWDALD